MRLFKRKKTRKATEKACCVYKTATHYKIVTESKADIGLFIEDDPVYILPSDCPVEEFKNAIFDAFSNSRENIPTPKQDEWSAWQKERIKKLKEKSYTNLYKNSTYCAVRLSENTVTLYPGKYNHQQGRRIIVADEDIAHLDYRQGKESEIAGHVMKVLGN